MLLFSSYLPTVHTCQMAMVTSQAIGIGIIIGISINIGIGIGGPGASSMQYVISSSILYYTF